MKHPLLIHKSTLNRLLLWHKPDFSVLYMIPKRNIALWLLYFAFFIIHFASAPVWFLTPITAYAMPLVSIPLLLSVALSLRLKEPIYTRKDYFMPTLAMSAFLLLLAVGSGRNINGIFMLAFSTFAYFCLFRLDISELRRLGDVLTLLMAIMLSVSIPLFIYHLLGGHLPRMQWSLGDYKYDNYLFFLIDHRSNWELIPRFQSVFIEPAHLGMACLVLLFCQAGKWNTWRCRILFLALLMSFSLAAYLCMVVMFFSVSWMKGRAVIGKILVLGAIILSFGVAAMFYNRGDNLINQLIVSRVLLNEEGKLEGDNRATGLFVREYEKAVESGDIIMGHGHESMGKFGFGNSGYRVFLYCYGFLPVPILLLLFGVLVRTSTNRRACASMLLLHALSFWAHGTPQRAYLFIPLYILLFSTVMPAQRITSHIDNPCKLPTES